MIVPVHSIHVHTLWCFQPAQTTNANTIGERIYLKDVSYNEGNK